jgi:hypothetical protein
VNKNDLEKAWKYFIIELPKTEDQVNAYFWARKGIAALRSMMEAEKGPKETDDVH